MVEAADMKTVQTVLFVILMAGASWWDIRKRIFPDHYVFLLICFLLLFHGAGTAVRAMQKKEPCQYYPVVPFLAAGNLILYVCGGSG